MNLLKIKNFPLNQYYQEIYNKKIIVLHHTVSGDNHTGDVNWWINTPEKVGTPYIIDRNGDVVETFDPKFWIHHLGIKQETLKKYGSNVTNNKLNQISIGIELDSWGALTFKNGKYYTFSGKEIPLEKVQIYDKPFRGSKYYEKYTNEQLSSLKELLLKLKTEFEIKLYYFENMFETNKQALNGYHGVFTHVSYREDKSDCHPQPELIQMLKSIKDN